MAYAGTQKYEGKTDVIWGEKEKQEQQFVTDFIVETLRNEAKDIELSEPFTSQAGTLLHIRTDINAKLKDDFSLEKIRSESTRLNSSHVKISYAVFCLKKKN